MNYMEKIQDPNTGMWDIDPLVHSAVAFQIAYL